MQRQADVTFANALRAILRQDPDVIMVGEMRDQETAEIAVQAAMTGHFVFSTLHTNDAASAIPRLIDLGIPMSGRRHDGGDGCQRLVRHVQHVPSELPAGVRSGIGSRGTPDRPGRAGTGGGMCGVSRYGLPRSVRPLRSNGADRSNP